MSKQDIDKKIKKEIVQELLTEGAEETEEQYVQRGLTLSVPSVELEELELPNVGKEYDAIIKRIKIGVLRQFIDIDKIRDIQVKERLEEIADNVAILVEFEIPSLNAVGSDVIRYSLHPNSKLMKLAKRYGKLKVGQKIKVVINEKGYPKISA